MLRALTPARSSTASPSIPSDPAGAATESIPCRWCKRKHWRNQAKVPRLAAEDVHGNRPAAIKCPDEPVRRHEDIVERDLGQFVVAVRLSDAAHLDAR